MSARIVGLVVALALACAGSSDAPVQLRAPDGVGESASASPSAATPEGGGEGEGEGEGGGAGESEGELVSVRPHVNDKYLKAGAVEKWSEILERERREVIAERDDIVAALELAPGMVVADIGAGTGAFMQALSVELGETGTLYAVDIVPSFVEHLRARAEAEGLDNVVVVEASATATNLPEGSVDVVFLCDVYHHIEYPSVYLRSLYDTLAPNGRMVIVEFDKVPGKTSPAMMEHVRQDKPTLLAEVTAEGFVLEREIDTVELDENYMLVFRK